MNISVRVFTVAVSYSTVFSSVLCTVSDDENKRKKTLILYLVNINVSISPIMLSVKYM